MPSAITGALQRAKHVVGGFTVAQRTIAIIGVAVLVLGTAALVNWATRPTMSPLFTGLSASDANAVVEQLRGASVPYEIADGGATVLVPEADVYDQRLAAAAAGLPSSGTDGYSLLDQMGVTTSQFQQSVAYKRAIEGELAKTIEALDGVSTASVRLAIPEESVFVSEKVDPTASVFVDTGRGTLDAQQVEAIVHLTSAAVSGLKPANVAVVDQTGHTLSAIGGDAAGSASADASDYETRVAGSVQRMLDKLVGTGKATVTVTADVDRSVSQKYDETYTPLENGAASSEHVRTETRADGKGGAGVLGPDNIAVPSPDGDSGYSLTDETRNNVINRSVESSSTPAGSISRLSVSVAVDASAAAGIPADQLNQLVSAAAGIDTSRGDVLSVETVAFSPTDADAAKSALQAERDAAEADRRNGLIGAAMMAAAIGLPVLIAVLSAILLVRRRMRPKDEFEAMFGEDAPRGVLRPPSEELAAATVPMELTGPDPVLGEGLPEIESEPAQVSIERRRAEIEAASRRDPKRTAELLRSLITEGRR
jgi:flagellar M-ring protein FliF